MKTIFNILFIACFVALVSCDNNKKQRNTSVKKIAVIFDTDANNELDDQHALAYLLFSGKEFIVKGITVNATYNGGDINEHYAEAKRVAELCALNKSIPILKGANADYVAIKNNLDSLKFDGGEAVNFIIKQAKMHTEEKLVILAVGKLTNVALALKKEPSISENIRLIWLGSNYPEAGEYNLENDIPAMNFLLNSTVDFELVTVRYGKSTGTDAVRLTQEEAPILMKGLGVQLKNPVVGRHGGEFYNFGDYSVSLFENCHYYGNPPSRALFDMAAVAIVKDSSWAKSNIIPGLIMVGKKWVEQPNNKRKIKVWENFDEENILSDFVSSLKNFKQVNN